MSVSLSKGENVSLTKLCPSLKKIRVELHWKPRITVGQEFDLDTSVFLLGLDDKVSSDADFIFYNQLQNSNGSVVHAGDDKTGQSNGEKISIDLPTLPKNVTKIAFVVTIHEAAVRNQSFGQVDGASIILFNEETGEKLSEYDLTETASTESAMLFGELYRNGDDFKFRAVGQGYDGGLKEFSSRYGSTIH